MPQNRRRPPAPARPARLRWPAAPRWLTARLGAGAAAVAAAVLAAVCLSAPSGQAAAPTAAATADLAAPAAACGQLAGQTLDQGGILAQVTSAAPAPYNGATWCQVRGYIAPQEQFVFMFPPAWDGDYLQEGCGGQCGSASVTAAAPAVSQGCMAVAGNQMVLGSDDEGHEGPGSIWAADGPAERVAYGYASEHLLDVTARALIKDYYGRAPADSYYDGCSTGGREALAEAQRYPADFQGILAGSPVSNLLPLSAEEHAWVVLANTDSSGREILTSAQIPALHAAVMRACANAAGYIPDPRACGFNPASIQCPAGQASDACLTAAQVAVADKLYQGPEDPQGQLLYPGGEPFGSELAWPGTFISPAGDAKWPLDTVDGQFAAEVLQYEALPQPLPSTWTLADWQFTLADFDKLSAMAGLYDAVNPDLAAFAKDGGKLIIWQPLEDQDQPPTATIQYYGQVAGAAGGFTASQQFSRLYAIPGGYHCEQGGTTEVSGDLLTPLMAWVRQGRAPGTVSFPVVSPSASSPAALDVAPMNPLAPVPGGGRGLNDDYGRYVGGYPSSATWCTIAGLTTRCSTRPDPGTPGS